MKDKQKSNCCNSEIKVVGGDEGTNHYECQKCHQACDILSEGTKSDSSQWEKEWLLFKNRAYGKHSNLWLYDKILTLEVTENFIRLLLQKAKEEFRQELKKKVESKRDECFGEPMAVAAIDDILKLLQE